jgi:hypothetical protein
LIGCLFAATQDIRVANAVVGELERIGLTYTPKTPPSRAGRCRTWSYDSLREFFGILPQSGEGRIKDFIGDQFRCEQPLENEAFG